MSPHQTPASAELEPRARISLARRLAGFRLATPFVELLRSVRRGRLPHIPVGWVRFGNLRRLKPVSENWGFDRGGAIDRWYIERFLDAHQQDVRGRVLEVGADRYASRFGGDRVTSLEILDIDATNPDATIIADLAAPRHLPESAFDCIIVTQTLHLVFDLQSAMRSVVQMLVPGGVALITVPGISPIEPPAAGATWNWSLTTLSLTQLVRLCADVSMVTVDAHGNVLAATAFLFGLGAPELTRRELEHADPAYPVIITARVVRSASSKLR